ncbi:MAG: GerMN domain-containing protein [Bacillota bacterium]
MLKRRGILFCFLGILLFLAGCGFLPAEKTKARTQELPYLKENPEALKTAGQPSLSPGAGQAGGRDGGEGFTGRTTAVVLYFADKNGYLVAYPKEIPKVVGIGRRTLEELCQGPPADSGLYPTIPAGARLKDINIKENGLAIVDFSQNLKSRHWGGATGELLTVYSIVNTLTQFPTVQEVQILIEGERVQTLAGHLDISKPLRRDGSLIRARTQESEAGR